MSFDETICELDGQLMTMSSHIKNSNDLQQHLNLPHAHFTLENFKRSNINDDPASSAFIHKNDTFHEKIFSAWKSQGFSGLLSEVSNSKESDNVPSIVKKCCRYILHLSELCASVKLKIFPQLKLSDQQLAAEFSSNNDWKESCVRVLSWHPYANKFALALIDDTVRIYYNDNELVPLLKHKQQRNVVAVEWKPSSSSILAVMSHTCILIWNVDPQSLSSRPSSGSMQLLTYPSHTPITSIQWNTHGFDLLFASSALDSSIVVWDVGLATPTIVQKVSSSSGGISKLLLSPDGSKMLVATPDPSFRVYQTSTWTNEKWNKLDERLQTACWSPKGNSLLFGVKNGNKIYSISFPDNGDFPDKIDGSKNASVAIELQNSNDEHQISEKLHIHSMIMNQTGERMAILLNKESIDEQVALFTTSHDPIFTATPRGFVNVAESTTFIIFKPLFKDGALLTMCSKDGQVSHIPLYFNNNHNDVITKEVANSFKSSLYLTSTSFHS